MADPDIARLARTIRAVATEAQNTASPVRFFRLQMRNAAMAFMIARPV